MFLVITHNTNGLHNPLKWVEMWQNLPRCDVICLQEIHLTTDQLYAFGLHCQGYTWHFSLGTSNSTSVGITIKNTLNVGCHKAGEISGRLLVLDLEIQGGYRIMNVYAPNDSASHLDFFKQLSGFVRDNTVLLGDFNSVIQGRDHLSGRLDGTSCFL